LSTPYGSQDLLQQIAHDHQTRDKIVILHRTSDEELSWLYQNCLRTMYPSFYEGWGLPVSESLAYGKYCLASNSSSLPEAGAGLVNHLDPLDFAAWLEAVTELMRSPERLAAVEGLIRARYCPMTWERSAEVVVATLGTLRASQ
jgi:glycosyltransferase involved in cell wall biosynthesis